MLPKFVNPGEKITASWANAVVSSLRSITNGKSKSRGRRNGGGTTTLCPFGQILSLSGNDYIRGGMIFCGDKNFTVPNVELETPDSTKLYYFEIPCEVNMDDASEILLPSIKTSSWSVSWEDTTDDEYPDNTNPVVGTGIGTIIIPIGQVVTVDGKVTFSPVGCGNIVISHCGGTLSHSRGS